MSRTGSSIQHPYAGRERERERERGWGRSTERGMGPAHPPSPRAKGEKLIDFVSEERRGICLVSLQSSHRLLPHCQGELVSDGGAHKPVFRVAKCISVEVPLQLNVLHR